MPSGARQWTRWDFASAFHEHEDEAPKALYHNDAGAPWHRLRRFFSELSLGAERAFSSWCQRLRRRRHREQRPEGAEEHGGD